MTRTVEHPARLIAGELLVRKGAPVPILDRGTARARYARQVGALCTVLQVERGGLDVLWDDGYEQRVNTADELAERCDRLNGQPV